MNNNNSNPYSFTFRNLKQFKKETDKLNCKIPVTDDIKSGMSLLQSSISTKGKIIPNRLCIHPMEGCDGNTYDGSPGLLTFRRYKRFACGGAGLIWVEATAVTPEGRANPRQLWINKESAPVFTRLVETIKNNSVDKNGTPQKPFTVLQLTHSGRYSKPSGKPEPMIFYHSPLLDPTHGLDKNYPLISDDYMDSLKEKYIKAAKYAYKCGFDAVDIKSCHGYLIHETLSSYKRENSKYGGSFENRTRFLTDVINGIRKEVPDIIVTTRLNIYDAYPYPYGWGMKPDGSYEADLIEPLRLISILYKLGVEIINICVGNPYYNPHIERPYDYPIQGLTVPDKNPIKIIEKNIELTEEVARNHPELYIVSTGLSWLRQIAPNVGMAMLQNRQCDIVGIGRLALANPGFANEILTTGTVAPERTCITCSSCTQIMRDNGKSGCVIRDSEVYGPIYYQGRLKSKEYINIFAEHCRNCWGAACMANCPAGIDVPGFIKLFCEGNIKGSYELIRKKNVLPETCAYTCPAEVLCEKNCTAGILYNNKVPIHEIQKFVSVKAREMGWTKVINTDYNGKKVAVIGFGPAGIACTTHLVEKGYQVTVYEASNMIGGTAQAVIPHSRLPETIIRSEVESFKLPQTGLFVIKYNKRLDKDFTLDNIENEGFDAIFLASGLCESTGLPFDNKPEGVIPAMDFLNTIKRNKFFVSPEKKAAVIGGGNTAMDAAISLKDAGVKDVYLIYRRSYNELPAWKCEVDKALEKGVHFLIFNQPVGYLNKTGKLSGIKLAHTVLGKPDSSGRPTPHILEDSQYILPVSICIEATGQKISDATVQALQGVSFKKGKIVISNGKHATTRNNVFAGGDMVNGGMTVVQAVKEGLDAAEEISRKLEKTHFKGGI